MEWSWLKGLEKAAITAGVAALGVAAASFFGAFDEVVEWNNLGAPVFIGPIAIMGVDFLRNFVKQWLKSLEPTE